MTDRLLTERLARQVLHWKVTPDRFLTGNRSWIPRWRFQPTEKLEDAFRVLEQSAPQFYSMKPADNGEFSVTVRIGGKVGTAQYKSKPRAITLAVVRALGVEEEDCQ